MRRPEGRDRPLAELAARQHGVVSARQLRALGYSGREVEGAARAGRLLRVHRGVYAVGHLALDWHGRCLAAVLSTAPALASHATAGRLWGLLAHRPSTFDVTAPTRRHRRGHLRIHHADLGPPDGAVRDAIPVTSVARTVLDLAATLPAVRLEAVLERAEKLEIFDLRAIDELLARVAHHRGAGPLRTGLDVYRDDPAFTRSGLERRFLALVLEAGLPRPSMNFNVLGLELDAYWEAERFAVELDAFETHGGRVAFERDRLRTEHLKLAGVETIRITGKRLRRDPEGAIANLAALLERRRRDLGLRRPGSGAR